MCEVGQIGFEQAFFAVTTIAFVRQQQHALCRRLATHDQ
jgi:hypothetical protein